jgi:Carboxypeptidase regulatory-like domain
MRRLAALVALGLFALPLSAAAQGPATIRGRVYDCDTGSTLTGVPVVLRNVDDGSVVRLRSGQDGRFARVGLQPGRYLIAALPEYRAPRPFATRDPRMATFASRLARVETDDVLDLILGTRMRPTVGPNVVQPPPAGELLADDQPQPLCDPALVPRALPTTDRYIMH